MPVSDVERKLAEYRAKKEREATYNRYKAKVTAMFSKFLRKSDAKDEERKKSQEVLLSCSSPEPISDTGSFSEDQEIEAKQSLTLFNYIEYLLYFILWLTLYVLFIKLQFGTIYFIVTAIIGMYLNTRTGPKKKGEVSAYSVFNTNFESIEGTLDADKLTKEMLYGGFSR